MAALFDSNVGGSSPAHARTPPINNAHNGNTVFLMANSPLIGMQSELECKN
jgi:hypothetical protein